MPTTTGRSRGRQGVRAGAQGAGGEHVSKITTTLIAGAVVIILVLVMTKQGRDITAATQRFMLYYAGVFALIGLTASVGVGLVATDRIIMSPGHRVMAQAVHRAVSFGALAFLIIHIVTEILAQRAHVIDAFIPFLSPFRTFYIGLGTIASDLILLIVITSVMRKRFTAHGKAWRWRAIHYSSYVAFVFGVLHGLLGGRTAKPYVDWSYGFAIALTALAIVVRYLAISLRSKETLSAPPGADRASGGLGYSGTSPLRSAALNMAQAQLGGAIQMLPASGTQGAGQPWTATALPSAPGWSAASGSLPALSAAPAPAPDSTAGFPTLGAPVYADPPRSALTGQGGAGPTGRQPLYEPGYDGPPRFEGAPRNHIPQDDLSYPYAPSGPVPRLGPGPASRPGGAPMPRTDTGPMPRADTGPMPRLGSGPMPRADSRALPRANTGPLPRANTGPMPRADSGPFPRANTGPFPRADSGPMPRADSGPFPRANTGPMPRPNTGPMPRADSGPMARADSGALPRGNTGPMSRADSGAMPRADSGPMPRLGTGPVPRADTGPAPRPGTGPTWTGNGPAPRPGTGQDPHAAADRRSRADARHRPAAGSDPLQGPRTGGATPQTATRPRRKAGATDPRHRDTPGHAGGDEWR